jgi:hypothetical protein
LIKAYCEICKFPLVENDAISTYCVISFCSLQRHGRCPGNGDRVEIRGLCSFDVKEYASHVGCNPKSGEQVTVKTTKKKPVFRMGMKLRRRVDVNSAVKLCGGLEKWIYVKFVIQRS